MTAGSFSTWAGVPSASSLLIQQKKLGAGGKRPGDFQLALFAVGQVGSQIIGGAVQAENTKDFQGFLIHFLFFPGKAAQMEHTFGQGVGHLVVKACFYIIEHGQFGEQTDILKGTGDTHFTDICRFFADQVFAVQADAALRGLVYTGKHIEYGGFSGAVGTDKAHQAAFLYLHGQFIHRPQAAEGDAKFCYVQHCHSYASSLSDNAAVSFGSPARRAARFSRSRVFRPELLKIIMAMSRIA